MTRPATRARHFYKERLESGYYDEVAEKGAAKWREILDSLPPERRLEVATQRIGELLAVKARVIDKLALFKTVISDGCDSEDMLTDDDALAVLVGWATERNPIKVSEVFDWLSAVDDERLEGETE